MSTRKLACQSTWILHAQQGIQHSSQSLPEKSPTRCMCINAGQMPKVYKTKKGGMYMKTGGGSAVGVSEDEAGRVFMFDRAGNLYYDTGDKRLGFYIVSPTPAAPYMLQCCQIAYTAQRSMRYYRGLLPCGVC